MAAPRSPAAPESPAPPGSAGDLARKRPRPGSSHGDRNTPPSTPDGAPSSSRSGDRRGQAVDASGREMASRRDIAHARPSSDPRDAPALGSGGRLDEDNRLGDRFASNDERTPPKGDRDKAEKSGSRDGPAAGYGSAGASDGGMDAPANAPATRRNAAGDNGGRNGDGGSYPSRGGNGRSEIVTETIVVEKSQVGFVVGHAGANIRAIIASSGATVDTDKATMADSSRGSFTITGTRDQVRECVSMIRARLSRLDEPGRHGPPDATLHIWVPVEKVGLVIGGGGSTLRNIRSRSGAAVDVQNDKQSDGRKRVVVSGTAQSTEHAKALILELADGTATRCIVESIRRDGGRLGEHDGSRDSRHRDSSPPRVYVADGRGPSSADNDGHRPFKRAKSGPDNSGYAVSPLPSKAVDDRVGSYEVKVERTVATSECGIEALLSSREDALRDVEDRAGVSVTVVRGQASDSREKQLSISGPLRGVERAQALLEDHIRAQYGGTASLKVLHENRHPPRGSIRPSTDAEGSRTDRSLSLAANVAGLIVGKKGRVVQDLEARSGASISVADREASDSRGNFMRVVSITGTPGQIDTAKSLIDRILDDHRRVVEAGRGQNQRGNFRRDEGPFSQRSTDRYGYGKTVSGRNDDGDARGGRGGYSDWHSTSQYHDSNARDDGRNRSTEPPKRAAADSPVGARRRYGSPPDGGESSYFMNARKVSKSYPPSSSPFDSELRRHGETDRPGYGSPFQAKNQETRRSEVMRRIPEDVEDGAMERGRRRRDGGGAYDDYDGPRQSKSVDGGSYHDDGHSKHDERYGYRALSPSRRREYGRRGDYGSDAGEAHNYQMDSKQREPADALRSDPRSADPREREFRSGSRMDIAPRGSRDLDPRERSYDGEYVRSSFDDIGRRYLSPRPDGRDQGGHGARDSKFNGVDNERSHYVRDYETANMDQRSRAMHRSSPGDMASPETLGHRRVPGGYRPGPGRERDTGSSLRGTAAHHEPSSLSGSRERYRFSDV